MRINIGVVEAIIDDDDVELIKGLRFRAHRVGRLIYARHTTTKSRKVTERIYLHRLVMRAPPDLVVDHINGDTLDCRKENLRLCTRVANSMSWDHPTKGVRRIRSGRWGARIKFKRREISLGTFDTQNEARKAYIHAVSQLRATIPPHYSEILKNEA